MKKNVSMKTLTACFSLFLGLTFFGSGCKREVKLVDLLDAHVESVCACEDSDCISEKEKAYSVDVEKAVASDDPEEMAKTIKTLMEKLTKCVAETAADEIQI